MPDLLDSNDPLRLDGQIDHISCSIEYPNYWYFRNAKAKEVLFKDWLVIYIKPEVVWSSANYFVPRNAAAQRGELLVPGVDGFRNMYSQNVSGARGKVYQRTPHMLSCCPTDDQAEVLVPTHIELRHIFGVAFYSEEQIRDEVYRLRLVGIEETLIMGISWFASPDLFTQQCSSLVRKGIRPVETKIDITSW
jgi:hypothetical protein